MAISPIAPYEIPDRGNWPDCRAPWRLQPSSAVLLIHDMQQYFLRPFVPGASPLRQLLCNLRAVYAACIASDIPVVFSAQPGEQDRKDRGLLWDLWGPGIAASPELQALSLELTPRANDLLLLKRRYSAFHETELSALMRERQREQLIICGIYAHIGCLATATDGFMRGVQPFVVSDGTADFSREDHLTALRQVAKTCGVVLTTSELLLSMHEQHVCNLLRELAPELPAELAAEVDLGDYGVDSIRLLMLAERLLQEFPRCDATEIMALRSVRDFAALVSRLRLAAAAIEHTPEQPGVLHVAE